LPQTQIPGVLFLGASAHEVEAGVFAGNIRVSLAAVSGPGNFFLYQTDSFGSPIQFMNSADGIDSSDFFDIPVGGHMHFNWAFTEEGMHTVTVQASGYLADGGSFTQSERTDFRFWVGDPAAIPEPTTGVLVVLGMLASTVVMRRKK
jgi:surface-anchored protein